MLVGVDVLSSSKALFHTATLPPFNAFAIVAIATGIPSHSSTTSLLWVAVQDYLLNKLQASSCGNCWIWKHFSVPMSLLNMCRSLDVNTTLHSVWSSLHGIPTSSRSISFQISSNIIRIFSFFSLCFSSTALVDSSFPVNSKCNISAIFCWILAIPCWGFSGSRVQDTYVDFCCEQLPLLSLFGYLFNQCGFAHAAHPPHSNHLDLIISECIHYFVQNRCSRSQRFIFFKG